MNPEYDTDDPYLHKSSSYRQLYFDGGDVLKVLSPELILNHSMTIIAWIYPEVSAFDLLTKTN